MNDKKVLSIEDREGKSLLYHFTPADFISNFTPLIVILDVNAKSEPLHFPYKMWNVLTPLNFENHDELLYQLVEELCDEYECWEHIYFYSTLFDEYKAIESAIASKANALYLSTPPSTKSLEKIETLFKSSSEVPLLYLHHSAETQDRKDEHRVALEDICRENKVLLRHESYSGSQENKESQVQQALDRLEKMSSQL